MHRPLTEVIGVVADIRTVALDEPPLLMVYLPAGPASRTWSGLHASLVVRATIAPAALATAVRGAIRSVDSGVPILHLRPMTEIVSESVGVRRFQMGLASLFAIFALLLAALGIYGVVGYSVARRRQELGIRMALGAQGSDLRNLVLLAGDVAGRGGMGGRRFSGTGGRWCDSRPAVRRNRTRSADHCERDPRRTGHRSAGVLHPRAPRDEGRSHGGAALRMRRSSQGSQGLDVSPKPA